MELERITNPIVRSKSSSVTTAVREAHQHPTTVDWERWKPIIEARYKIVTARVLIGEMNADGLLVTYVSLQLIGLLHTEADSVAERRCSVTVSANGA
jgi:hypothetical protein